MGPRSKFEASLTSGSAPVISNAPVRLTVEAMSAEGHGIANIEGTRIGLPFTLPGERVSVRLRGSKGEILAVENASPDRIEPVCKHFQECGGCALQHWRPESCAGWKLSLVEKALARAGLEAPPADVKTYPAASRRRATFAAKKTNGKLRFGYHAWRSHQIVNLEECPILLPPIASAVTYMRGGLDEILSAGSAAKIGVTAAANGLDCSLQGPPVSKDRLKNLAECLAAAGVVRAFWNGDMILLLDTPYILFGDVRAPLASEAFLQAVEACERDMASFVEAALRERKISKKPVCDLFSGMGAFSFAAAKLAPVTAYEQNGEAVGSLASAAREIRGLKTVTAVRRDLFRNALGPLELNKFGAVIANPPREGAKAQCSALARSAADTVIMLSCNPSSFARDAAILASGGFRLSRLEILDQFRYSPHVEIASLFIR